MELKYLILMISVQLTFFGSGSTTDIKALNEPSPEKPVHKCDLSGTYCVFRNIKLNSTHYEWQPTADNLTIVEKVRFGYDCVIPVATKDMCETFPALQQLDLRKLEIEEIKENAFHACHQLTHLELYDNKIVKLPQFTFLNTKNLVKLDLSWNLITNLEHRKMFANMPNLGLISFDHNELTDFSPELIRNNKELRYLELHSNHLSNIEAEKIVDFLPNLEIFDLDNNEMSCTRVVEINQLLASKGIRNTIANARPRFYPQEKVLGRYLCSPDLSWMASNHRKKSSKFEQQVESIKEKISNQSEAKHKYGELVKQLKASDERRVERLSKVRQRIDKMEEDIQLLINLVLDVQSKN